MRISLFQADVVHGDPNANLKRLESALPRHPGSFVVLPELFSTGYVFDSRDDLYDLAEPIAGGRTVDRLVGIAARHGTALVAGLAERADDRLYNSAVVVDAQGIRGHYRKRFLGSIDQRYFERGERCEVVELAGIRCGLMICFDIWFPELAREYLRDGIDLFLHPSSFGATQSLTVSRARAIESNTPVLTCNRVGAESFGGIDAHYRGQSQLIDGLGNQVHQCGGHEDLATIEFELSAGRDKRLLGVDLFGELEAHSHALSKKKD